MGTEGPGDMGTNGPKGLEDTGTEGPEGHGDMGYRDTADRWVGLRGAGPAPHCAPCPVPPAGHPHPWGTQQGVTLGARPHTRVFATWGWAHARTRVCVCAGQPGGAVQPEPTPGVIFTQPRWHRWPQSSRSTPYEGDGERNEVGNGLAASSMARHGHSCPITWSSQPHNTVIPAPWHRHPCPTTQQFCPKEKLEPQSRAVPYGAGSPCRAHPVPPPFPLPAAFPSPPSHPPTPPAAPPLGSALPIVCGVGAVGVGGQRAPCCAPPRPPRPRCLNAPLVLRWPLVAPGTLLRGRAVPGRRKGTVPTWCASPPAVPMHQDSHPIPVPMYRTPPHPVPTVPIHPCPHALGHPPHP